MTITVQKLIESLTGLDPDLPVYALHGASGTSNEVSSAQVAEVGEWEQGALLEMEQDAKYVMLYTGN